MPNLPSRAEQGFSLIEVIVATGVLCTAAVALLSLFLASADAMLAARHRTVAAMLARAKLEELRSDPEVARLGATGEDIVSASGAAEADTNGAYRRQWAVAPSAAMPEHLLVARVEVTSTAARRVDVQPVRLSTLLERRP
jgi:prepilin-type N-terminal cleavage/methylation domain-containing protein